VILGGAPEAPSTAPDFAISRARAEELLASGLSRKDTAARLGAELGLGRNEAYRIVTELGS
jgi:hypothetical protein